MLAARTPLLVLAAAVCGSLATGCAGAPASRRDTTPPNEHEPGAVPSASVETVNADSAATAPDRDADGVADATDGCPCLVEDLDGFEDDDGCPDVDDDGDMILDVCDACPRGSRTAETYHGLPDDIVDGCPDPVICRITEPFEIYFDDGSAELSESSASQLAPFAEFLHATPEASVQIIGRAADTERRPRPLSARRARAVLAALVDLGVDRARLSIEARGTDDGPEDDARERRVWFHTEGIEPPPPVVVPTSPTCPDGAPPPPAPAC